MPTVQEVLNQGWTIQQQGNYAAAEKIYRHVLQQAPGSAAGWCYLGIALYDQRRFEESEAAYRKALSLQNHFPIAWNNLGNTLRMLGQVEQADQAFETSLQQDPKYLSPLKNRGTLWVWTGQIDRGLAAFEASLEVAPNDPELHRNLGVIHLLKGDFRRGWDEYRWRWKMPGFVRPNVSQPVWNGSDPQGKTFLLYSEQGLGDAIHFVRMAIALKERGARTIVQAAPKLIPLLSTCRGIDQLIPEGMLPGNFDFHCSFIDAADRLGIDVESIPDVGPYLGPSENLQAYWANWLAQIPGKKKVGICWQGNPQHQADIFRSIPLQAFEPLASIPDVQLVCLQHGFGIQQLDQVDFADQIVRLPANLDQSSGAFMDTAAIMKGLDLVVTSDTSVAHLAGALGVPVWVGLPKVPDWRWLLQGDSSPWYPSMRLFRQPEMKNWAAVMAEIKLHLERF
ncbi:tetratricopeptide repeat protein [Rosistilla oblonga]|uniref:Lipoprotein NlpI n=1 Tax=Rosistilla oblonga TaxID=2527990 RepID=A0A518IPP5_9BACT|nr:tetratricopeptide repeat-containing glycosyltransferase family protein [Rosistilla oblonga]QDV55047.1 lipoprotein NlpI [Rosistilla oblonga]